MKKRVLLITNIPSPYRVDLFHYIQTNVTEFDFSVLYSATGEDNRVWNVNNEKIRNSYFLRTKVLTIRRKYDTQYKYIPIKLRETLHEINPDIIIGMEYNPVSLSALFWTRKNKKKFINLTDGTLNSEKSINLIQKLNRKIIISKCDAAIASSTKAKEKLLAWGIEQEKIFVSLLTVDLTTYKKIERVPEPGRLLYVGSMIERKGLDLLIRALPFVKTAVTLRIVGNGTEDQIEELKKIACNVGVENRIVFCGFKQGEELAEEYKKAMAFILPTREDCFGLVLLEAIASGVPVVSSIYADGAYDIVIPGENGFLVDPYNEKEMASAIDQVLSNNDGYKRDAFDVEKFDFSKVVQGYKDAVEYVLAK